MNPKLPDSFTLKDLEELYTKLGLKTQASYEFLVIMLENVILMDAKQQDYGSKNISKFGAFGCLIRMSDKIERLVHLYKNKRRKTINESVTDSFRDISNYAGIALQSEKGKWPNE